MKPPRAQAAWLWAFNARLRGPVSPRKPQRFCEVHNGRNTACAQDGSRGETSEARRKVGWLLIDIGARGDEVLDRGGDAGNKREGTAMKL